MPDQLGQYKLPSPIGSFVELLFIIKLMFLQLIPFGHYGAYSIILPSPIGSFVELLFIIKLMFLQLIPFGHYGAYSIILPSPIGSFVELLFIIKLMFLQLIPFGHYGAYSIILLGVYNNIGVDMYITFLSHLMECQGLLESYIPAICSIILRRGSMGLVNPMRTEHKMFSQNK